MFVDCRPRVGVYLPFHLMLKRQIVVLILMAAMFPDYKLMLDIQISPQTWAYGVLLPIKLNTKIIHLKVSHLMVDYISFKGEGLKEAL